MSVREDGSFLIPLALARKGVSRWKLEVDAFASGDLAGASASIHVRPRTVRCTNVGVAT